jgi:hypothetical protein
MCSSIKCISFEKIVDSSIFFAVSHIEWEPIVPPIIPETFFFNKILPSFFSEGYQSTGHIGTCTFHTYPMWSSIYSDHLHPRHCDVRTRCGINVETTCDYITYNTNLVYTRPMEHKTPKKYQGRCDECYTQNILFCVQVHSKIVLSSIFWPNVCFPSLLIFKKG